MALGLEVDWNINRCGVNGFNLWMCFFFMNFGYLVKVVQFWEWFEMWLKIFSYIKCFIFSNEYKFIRFEKIIR